ncbi:MAG: flagellar export protein FliJ [Pseudomonadota bacterium]
MSERRTRRLTSVKAIFHAREQRFVDNVRLAEQGLRAASDRLALLRSAVIEHKAALNADYAGALQNHGEFLKRLTAAITAQETVVAQAEARASEARRALTAAQQRTQSIGKVCERRTREEQRAQDRREQRELDDLPRSAGRSEGP